MSQFDPHSIPEPPVSPPEPDANPLTKSVSVYIRFAGVDKIEMDVPADLDLTNSDAIIDYMDEWTMNHRPSWAMDRPAEPWAYTKLGLGEYWHTSQFNRHRKDFVDPDRANRKARIFIEAVEEE